MGPVSCIIHPLTCICSVHRGSVEVFDVKLVSGVDWTSRVTHLVSAELELSKDAISAIWSCIIVFSSTEVAEKVAVALLERIAFS